MLRSIQIESATKNDGGKNDDEAEAMVSAMWDKMLAFISSDNFMGSWATLQLC